jgi:hypothetical protein
MTKVEVEKNEEGLHKKWFAQMDQIVEDWQKSPTDHNYGEQEDDHNMLEVPRSPTYFERNLEVWRQLYVCLVYWCDIGTDESRRWRVTEISQIILVLLDSRCPLLHFPPSLSTYLSDRKVILVLTKVDISGPTRASIWTNYFNQHYPNLPVIRVEAYTEKAASTQHQGKVTYEPHLPESFRKRLVQAIKEVHAEMTEPPERIRADKEKMKRWKPPAKKDIDWDGVIKAGGGKVGSVVSGAAEPKPKPIMGDGDEIGEAGAAEEPEFLTIGLIGKLMPSQLDFGKY